MFHGPKSDDYVTLHQSTHDGSAWSKQRVLSEIVKIVENSVENHYVKPKCKEQKTAHDSYYLFSHPLQQLRIVQVASLGPIPPSRTFFDSERFAFRDVFWQCLEFCDCFYTPLV